MSKQIKATDNEKKIISIISSISGVPEKIVKKVFLSALMIYTTDYFDEEEVFKIVIPYLFSVDVRPTGQSTAKGIELVLDSDAKANQAMYNEVKAILNGDYPPTAEYIKNELKQDLNKKIDKKKAGSCG